MLRLFTAAIALATVATASAQDLAEAPAPAPAPAEEPAAAPTPERTPLEALQASLSEIRTETCRFSFSQSIQAAAQVGLGDAEIDSVVRFDPRGALGSRWTVVSATKRAKQMEKYLSKLDAQGSPQDLISLLPEGNLRFENLTFAGGEGGTFKATFTPVADPVRAPNEMDRQVLGRMEGSVEFRADGAPTRREFRVPEGGIKVGIAKLQSGVTARQFIKLPSGHIVADSEVQTLQASALLTSAAQQTTTRFTDVEPICDAAIVAEIAAREAEAQAGAQKKKK